MKLSVVAISLYKSVAEKVQIGQKVEIVKDPRNKEDAYAIRCMVGQECAGYVSGPRTVKRDKGCKPNTEVYNDLEDETEAIVVEKFVERLSKGHATYFILDVPSQKQEQPEDKKDQQVELEIQIGGANIKYPHRQTLIQKMNQGVYTDLTLKREDTGVSIRVRAFDGDEPVGIVASSPNYADPQEVLAAVEAMGGEMTVRTSGSFRTAIIVKTIVDQKEVEKKKAENAGKNIFQRIVADGILTEQELDERKAVFASYGVTPKQQLAVFESMVKYESDVAAKIPKRPLVLYKDDSGIVRRSVAYLNMRRNLLLEGERGVGKNVLTETIAWLYARPLFEFSLNSGHDNNTILGGKTIETLSDGTTKMGYQPEAIVQAAEHGGFIVLDEFNTGISSVLSVLNSLLDDRRRVEVPGYKMVEAHPNFSAFATQNRDYQGTFGNNEATIDRFVPIIFPEMKGIGSVVQAKVPNVTSQTLAVMESAFNGLQKLIRDGEVSEKAMSIRGFIDAALAVEMELTLKEALRDNLVNRMGDIDERVIVQAMLDDITG